MANTYPDVEIEIRDVTEEAAALREAVEVLEGMPQPSRAELAYYKAEMEWYRTRAIEAEGFEVHAYEAVEVLEDMYEQRDEEVERWFGKWMDGVSDLWRSQAALRDAEAKVAELHKRVNLVLQYKDEWRDRALTAEGHVARLRQNLDRALGIQP